VRRTLPSWGAANLGLVAAHKRAGIGPVRSRLADRALIAVQNRRIFPYLVGVIAATSVLTGLVAHVIDRKDFPSFGVAIWWAIVTLGTVGYGDVVPHTGCRMAEQSDDQIHELIQERAGIDTRSLDFGTETDQFQQLNHPINFFLSLGADKNAHRPSDDVDDLHARIQRRVWILKNHLNLFAQFPNRLVGKAEDLSPFEVNLAAGRDDKPGNQPGRGRFATTALPHQAENLALGHGKGNPVNGFEDPSTRDQAAGPTAADVKMFG